MDTLTETDARRDTPGRVVAAPLPWSPPAAPQKNYWALSILPIVLAVVIVLGLGNITLPYVSISPGEAEPINELVSVPTDKRFPPKGSFLLTTVFLSQKVRPLDWLRDKFDDDTILIPKKDLLGDSTQQQYNQQAAQDMTDSKTAAAVVALRALGHPVTERGEGALILDLAPGKVPARGLLAAGDAITMLDGTPTPLAQNAIDLLQKHKPGDTVIATVVQKSDGATVQKTITLGSRTADACTIGVIASAEGACLGVLLGTKSHSFDFPFDVKIDTSGIGGPSAGLAFTLALIDELTPGELTGGRNVAVTGTIDVDGAVGDVGGVAQKTAAVRQAGARLFLVPPGEFAEAKAHAGKKLKVVQVKTLADALAALARNGGDPVKLASPQP